MTATEILAEAAIAHGPRRQEDRGRRHGAARRRGHLASALRAAGAVAADRERARPTSCSASRPPRRCAGCNYLRPGALALVNTARFVPPVVDGGLYEYPEDPVGADAARWASRCMPSMPTPSRWRWATCAWATPSCWARWPTTCRSRAEVLFDCVVRRFQKRKPHLVN
ncbi:MAG: hypothetical protein MZW92_11790 [Comamonadaceae bacterium]|nr:hypothetical protein [Comamonadaceae bacterium]